MTRIPTWGAALLALALIILLPGIALAQDATVSIPALAPLLALIPGGAIWAPVAVAAASLLDALLPHPAAGSPLAIPRALITLLAVNVGRASNAQGIGLVAALKAVGGSVGGGIGAALASPITGIVAAEVEKALAARTDAASGAIAAPTAQPIATTPIPANDTPPPGTPVPASVPTPFGPAQ